MTIEPTAIATTQPAVAGDPEVPPSGVSIGRFVVLGTLGIGGMAFVVSAYDPKLDRRVALKLLRPDARHADMLVREAQTTARLNHPNVVAVYEVGQLDNTDYLAMEQIDGGTLREWLAAAPRAWSDVVTMLVAAGAGLAAAHRAGIVHRDFKPDNVLVGSDGRPRVSDFGLAQAVGAGTRGYMPPEQEAGERGDARSDQYAFCVTLWEALHGERPDASIPSSTRRAPAWLCRVIRRGLAADPSARWPSMDALLARLRRRGRFRARAAIAAVSLAAVGGAAFAIGRCAADSPAACEGAEVRLVGVWDPPRGAAVRGAFAATRMPYAAAAWRTASAEVDDYARTWTAMHTETCRATQVDGRQSSELLDLRMACLERRRSVLAALIELWAAHATPEVVESAIGAARKLPSLDECADAVALTGRVPLPPNPLTAGLIGSVRAQLDRVTALDLAGRYADARVAADAARATADQTEWPQVRAEAALAQGKVLADLLQPGVEAHLLEAAQLAGAARDDRLAAEAQIELVQHLAEDQLSAPRALLVAQLADGAVIRAGNDCKLQVRLVAYRGAAHLVAGDDAAARTAFTRSRDLAARCFGEHDWQTVASIGDLARVADHAGDYTEAVRLGEQVLAAAIDRFGADHPVVASVVNNLALAADHGGDRDRAAGYYQRALAIKRAVYGPESEHVANAENNLALIELDRGRAAQAAVLLERALAIRERVLGPDHARVAQTLHNLGGAYRQLGRTDRAFAVFERALAIKTRVYGPTHDAVAATLTGLGWTWAAVGNDVRGLDYFQRAREMLRRALGANHPRVLRANIAVGTALVALGRYNEASPLLEANAAALERTAPLQRGRLAESLALLGECELAAGRAPRAVTLLERALALCEADHARASDFGLVHWPLGRALWSAGRREAARAAIERAVVELATDEVGARQRAAARTWLATHRL